MLYNNLSGFHFIFIVTCRWSLIAGRLPGRTDNEVKNYWNTHLNKRLPSGKRKSTDSNPDQDDNNTKENKSKRLRALGDSQPTGNTSPMGSTEELEGKNQEKEERSAVSDVWAQQDAQSMMNYYIESPMVPDNNATFVFDDEPFLAYWDSFVLFESVGCGGDWWLVRRHFTDGHTICHAIVYDIRLHAWPCIW